MKFKIGDRVRKVKGSNWQGIVVGYYSTELTPEGYTVESDTEKGSVQIYPAAALELIVKAWEPEVGEYYYYSGGVGEFYSTEDGRDYGIERKTIELAERSYKEARAFNRLLAYRDEFCPEYVPDWDDNTVKKYYLNFHKSCNEWTYDDNIYCRCPTVYFPLNVIKELVRKLNSGEVIL